MPDILEARWLLLKEAADLFSQHHIPASALRDILKIGLVPLRGRRIGFGFGAEPIDHLLPRMKTGRVAILLFSNEIELWLDSASADEQAIAKQFASYPAILLPSDWFLKFTDVRAYRSKLIEEAEAAGFTFAKATSALAESPGSSAKRGAYFPFLDRFLDGVSDSTGMSNDAIAGNFMFEIDAMKASGEPVPKLPARRYIEIQVEKRLPKIRQNKARAPKST